MYTRKPALKVRKHERNLHNACPSLFAMRAARPGSEEEKWERPPLFTTVVVNSAVHGIEPESGIVIRHTGASSFETISQNGLIQEWENRDVFGVLSNHALFDTTEASGHGHAVLWPKSSVVESFDPVNMMAYLREGPGAEWLNFLVKRKDGTYQGICCAVPGKDPDEEEMYYSFEYGYRRWSEYLHYPQEMADALLKNQDMQEYLMRLPLGMLHSGMPTNPASLRTDWEHDEEGRVTVIAQKNSTLTRLGDMLHERIVTGMADGTRPVYVDLTDPDHPKLAIFDPSVACGAAKRRGVPKVGRDLYAESLDVEATLLTDGSNLHAGLVDLLKKHPNHTEEWLLPHFRAHPVRALVNSKTNDSVRRQIVKVLQDNVAVPAGRGE